MPTCECDYCQADEHPRWKGLLAERVEAIQMVETILYCQLGGHLSPNATAEAVLDKAREALARWQEKS